MTRSPDNFARLSGTEGVRENLKEKSVRAAIFVAASGAFDILLRIVAISILARLISPEHFGLLAMVTALTAFVEGFQYLGLSMATVQRYEVTHGQVSNLFWVNASAGFLFALSFCVLSPQIAVFYNDERLVGITIALAMIFIVSGLSVQHEALMTRQLKQGELSAIRLTASILSTVLAIALALWGWGYWALVAREVTRSLLVAVGIWARCPWLPGLPRRGQDTGSLLKFGVHMSLTDFVSALIANIDRVLIGRFYGPIPVGHYRQAQQLLVAPIEQLNSPIMSVAQPALSALQHEPDRYRRYYKKIVFLVSLTTVPFGLFVAFYAPEITLLILGPSWTDAAIFIRIFGLAASFRPALSTSAIVLVTCGKTARYLAIAVIHGAVLTVLLLVGIRWGAEGVALAHVGTTVLLAVPKLYYSFVDTPVSVRNFVGAVQTPVVASMAMIASLLALHLVLHLEGVLLPLAVGAGVAGPVYVGAWLLQPKGWFQFKTLSEDIRTSLQRRRVREA